MKTTRFFSILCCALLAAAFTSCDKNAHEDEYPLGEGEGAFIVGLTSGTPVDNLSVLLFDANGLPVMRNDYTDPRTFAREYLPLKTGSYTLVVVANVTPGDLPEEAAVADLAEWLRERTSVYPDMLTASMQGSVTDGKVERRKLAMSRGAAGIILTDLTLRIDFPDSAMPDYASRAEEGLRLVAEAYVSGTQTRIHHRAQLCTPQPDGSFLATLCLLPGTYDLCLWADRPTDGSASDGYYDTSDLTSVSILTDGYAADAVTDAKDAGFAMLQLRVGEEDFEQAVGLTRPFARYRLVASDVQGYLNLIEKGEPLPPIEELEARISYESFLPSNFNVISGEPNDSQQGISYRALLTAAEGYAEDEALRVGADFVLAGSEESFVTVTVRIIDGASGETVSSTPGVKIPYRRGELTTVSGTFLTAGRTSGGVEIDTSWGEDLVIEF